MRQTLAIITLAALIAAVPASGQTITRSYGWEDGGTVHRLFGNATDATNVSGAQNGIRGSTATAFTVAGPNGGSRYLHVAEQPQSGTPQACLALVQGLSASQTVTAEFYGYDDTAGGSPSLRIWAAWINADGAFLANMSGVTMPGNPEYTAGGGWGISKFTFNYGTPPTDATGIEIQARLYSQSPDGAYRTDYFIDDMTVTAPDTATILFPGEVLQAKPFTALTTVGTEASLELSVPSGTGSYTFRVADGLNLAGPTLAASGQLFDTKGTPDTADDVDVTAGNANVSSTLRFVPGASGLFQFTYTASTGTSVSNPATVLVGVQNGAAVITEIMHRPNNYPYANWEWLEIANTSGSDVFLGTITDTGLTGPYNVIATGAIPAGTSKIALADVMTTLWLAEWNDGERPGAPATNIDASSLITIDTGSGVAKPEFNENDTIFLFDIGGELVDAVAYQSNANGWPAYINGSSLFLEDGQWTAVANDLAANWKVSLSYANNSYPTPEAADSFNDSDTGSPLLAPGGPTVVPAITSGAEYILNANGPALTITLTATPATGTYLVGPLTAYAPTTTVSGVMRDPAAGNADVTAGGALAGNTVEFTPAASGIYQFSFQVDNGAALSNKSQVRLFVQDNTVVVTEIMADPSNRNTTGTDDFDWEWIEIYNPSASPVALHSLADEFNSGWGNLAGYTIDAGATLVIAPGDDASRTAAEFLTEWAPLDGAKVLFVANPNDMWRRLVNGGDTLRLVAADGRFLDAVVYDDVAPWPSTNNKASIYLKPGVQTPALNDAGANWARSAAGVENAYESDTTTQTYSTYSDVGSPTLLPLGTPTAASASFLLNKNASAFTITLPGSDPNAQALTYKIMAGLAAVSPTVGVGGTLTDPAAADADVTAGNVNLAGNTVAFTPAAGVSGAYNFTYQVTDADSLISGEATVTLYVQDENRVVITEIMYDPANAADNDWEWVEVKNVSAGPITVHSLISADEAAKSGSLGNRTLAAGEVLVVIPDDNTSRTLAQFLAEWAPLSGTQVAVVPTADWATLGNTGDLLVLRGADGTVLDGVQYASGGSWPSVSPGGPSLSLRPDKVDSFLNDAGASWLASAAGVHQAWATPETDGTPLDSDTGSPGIVSSGPTAAAQTVYANTGATLITLSASDPDASPLTFTIVEALTAVAPTTALNGSSLTDPNNANQDVTAGGTLTGTSGQVNFNLGLNASGIFTFSYQAADASATSNTAKVTIYAQKGGLVITEVMYNPSNVDDNDWEWVEVTNTTGSPISVDTITDASLAIATMGNLAGVSIPAQATVILAPGNAGGDTSSRTGAAFLAEWAPLNASSVIWVPELAWPALGNGGDSVMIFEAGGGLFDVVAYASDGVVWPAVLGSGSQSIAVICDNFTASANDAGAAWALSVAGTSGAYATPETAGTPADSDVGSPAVLPVCVVPPTVTGRHIFYNQSAWDGNSVAANVNDDSAIAPDKEAYIAGTGAAKFKNYISYNKSINGIMVDIKDLPVGYTVTAADFEFKVGNTNTPNTWAAAPAPTSVTQRVVGDNTRVTVLFANNAIGNSKWLQVKVKAAGIGLAADDVHYWGVAYGESGNSALNAIVNATDINGAKNNSRTLINPAPVDFRWDYNRDKKVDATDMNAARNNGTDGLSALRLINIP